MIKIVFGLPKRGKTYVVTRIARDELKKGKRTVYSNYPIYFKKYGFTNRWYSDLVEANITNSVVIIDEAYLDFNSRGFKDFSESSHLFFSLSGHNNNDIYLVAHSPARIEKIVREMTETFLWVEKAGLPFLEFPLWFRVETYLDEMSIAKRFHSTKYRSSVKRYRFSWSIADAYDYQQFRSNEPLKVEPESWGKFVNLGSLEKKGLMKSLKGLFTKSKEK